MFGPLREEIRNEEKYQKRMSNSTSSSISTNPEAHTITSLTPWSQITDMKVNVSIKKKNEGMKARERVVEMRIKY